MISTQAIRVDVRGVDVRRGGGVGGAHAFPHMVFLKRLK